MEAVKYKPFRGVVLQDLEDIEYFLKCRNTPITEEKIRALEKECEPFRKLIHFDR